MITHVFIDGFKSLSAFEVDIRPGLNVLVGPNGAGKSNILTFFAFLATMSRYRLPEAISRSGGAGTIFRRTADQGIEGAINIRLKGYGRATRDAVSHFYSYPKARPGWFIEYEYAATIRLGEKGAWLGFEQQRLCLSVFANPQQRTVPNRNTGGKRWHVEIATKAQGDSVKVTENKMNYTAIKDVYGDAHRISNYSINQISDSSNSPLYTILRTIFPAAAKIHRDISTGFLYNLNPAQIKEAEDIARVPEISEDGSGLAATLFDIQQRENQSFPHYLYRRVSYEENRVTLARLKDLYRLVNSNISDIEVLNDNIENKLVVVALIKAKGSFLKIPLAMLSDGTVKWLSLVTAILTRRAIFSIEEPENFLHPYMQQELIQLLRGSSTGSPEVFSLVTTHSETVLNALDPSEILVVSMDNGATRVNRSDDADLLRSEIESTGFGLGHLYVSGILS